VTKRAGYLGIDLGTSAVKAMIVSSDGTKLGYGRATYPTDRPHPGWAEQDPEEWWIATCAAVREAVAAADAQVLAIGITGQMHGTVLLDEQELLLGPAIIWEDTRSERIVTAFNTGPEAEIHAVRSGARLQTGFQLATLEWLRTSDPVLFNRISHVLLPKDYLKWRLTGAFSTDASDASGTGLFDIETGDWSPAGSLTSSDLDRFPEILSSTAVAGTLSPEVATEFGLHPGIPTVTGGGDAPVTAAAAGVTSPDRLLVVLSTGAQVILPSHLPMLKRSGSFRMWRSVFDGGWNRMGAIDDAGSIVNWLKTRVFDVEGVDGLQRMLSWAEDVPLGSDGVSFSPFLTVGKQIAPNRTVFAGFNGLRPEHGRGHLVSAALEGPIRELFAAYKHFSTKETPSSQLILAGGGSRIRRWGRIVADTFQIPTFRLLEPDASAQGAAMLAAIGTNPSLDTSSWPKFEAPIIPDPASPLARGTNREIVY
jgi:xylulokinase